MSSDHVSAEILKGAMTWSHRYVGNPILTGVLNRFFGLKSSDAHSGMRAFTKEALDHMALCCEGMEFASEIVVKAARANLRVSEVPITYHPRIGESKLNGVRDAWRHLRFMLILAPTYLFILPGLALFVLGLVGQSVLLPGPLAVGDRVFYVHFSILFTLLTLVGSQAVVFGVFARAYSKSVGFENPSRLSDWVEKDFSLERGLITGILFFVVGFGMDLAVLVEWISRSLGAINAVRPALFAMTFIVLGIQMMFALGTGLVLRSRDAAVPPSVPTRDLYRRSRGDRPEADADRLCYSVEGRGASKPDLSADQTLTAGQKQALLIAATVLSALVILAPNPTMVVVVGAIIALYFASLAVRLLLFMKALNGHGIVQVSEGTARAVPDAALPSYTVLVPAYGEPEVLHNLVTNLRGLEYPRDRLQMLLLLEEDDTPTVQTARDLLAEGTDITIFDAEDRPEPLQLRKAALALAAAPAEVACVQAKLDFFNPTQNMLTRWFTLDYRMWFTQLLPGLSQLGAPIPLGGTSNHFRREVLLEVGAWDALNVTEDADLGVRLHRAGYRTGVVDSTTYEEANRWEESGFPEVVVDVVGGGVHAPEGHLHPASDSHLGRVDVGQFGLEAPTPVEVQHGRDHRRGQGERQPVDGVGGNGGLDVG